MAILFCSAASESRNSGVESGDVVLEVLDLEGEFAADGLDTVYLAQYGLKFIEGFEALLDRVDLFVFLVVSHICYE